MIKKFIGALTVMLLLVSVEASAQLKIGYMDVQSVMSQLPEMKNIQQKLGEFISGKEQEMRERTADFQEAVAAYQENQASMSQEQQKSREEELAAMEQELRSFQQSIQQEIQQYRQSLLAPVYADIDSAIAGIAEQMGLDFVLNRATMQGESIVQFSSQESLNITNRVVERILNNSNSN